MDDNSSRDFPHFDDHNWRPEEPKKPDRTYARGDCIKAYGYPAIVIGSYRDDKERYSIFYGTAYPSHAVACWSNMKPWRRLNAHDLLLIEYDKQLADDLEKAEAEVKRIKDAAITALKGTK